MAKEIIERLIDDIDGGAAEATIKFSFNEAEYEIDLSKRNISAMEKVLRPYVSVARPVKKITQPKRATRVNGRAKRLDLSKVREWAAENGFDVAPRGRVAATIIDAYEAAH